MGKNKNWYHVAKKRGNVSNLDLLKARQIAKEEAYKMEKEAEERALLQILAIPLNVLVADYWPKSAKRKAPKFIRSCISLYASYRGGIVSDEELAALVEEFAGYKVTAEWLSEELEGVNKELK